MTAELDREIGANLRTWRRAAGLSQREVAIALGMTYQQVGKYEAGQNRISAANLWRLSQLYQIEPAMFFEGLQAICEAPRLENHLSALIHGFCDAPDAVRAAILTLLKDRGAALLPPTME